MPVDAFEAYMGVGGGGDMPLEGGGRGLANRELATSAAVFIVLIALDAD